MRWNRWQGSASRTMFVTIAVFSICWPLWGCARNDSPDPPRPDAGANSNQQLSEGENEAVNPPGEQLLSQDEIDEFGPQGKLLLSQMEIEELKPKVKQFCGDCHAYPEPQAFFSAGWREEVHNGFNFYLESGRSDLTPPPLEEVIQYYAQQAPDDLVLPEPKPIEGSSPMEWAESRIPSENPPERPIISSLEKFQEAGLWKVAATDMLTGTVAIVSFADGLPRQETIATFKHPAKVTPCDFNGDGHRDFLVAEMGTPDPADHDLGKVLWLEGSADDHYIEHTLLAGVGRIADVETGDFNGDGLNDVLVAEFGWRKSGGIHLLVQQKSEPGDWRFEQRLIDPRHGTIHLPVVDWNKDGHLDFVALVSQEHEAIDLFLNKGDATFTRETLYAASGPAFGSSGISLVDFDGDGDPDVLYTNGDTMDGYHLRPTHGIRWLENTGGPTLNAHLIGQLPGCYRALAADLDRDGDLDVVATTHFPKNLRNLNSDRERIAWFEQIDRAFEQHTVALGGRDEGHFALSLEDFTGDGNVDFLTGDAKPASDQPPLSLWQQRRISVKAGSALETGD